MLTQSLPMSLRDPARDRSGPLRELAHMEPAAITVLIVDDDDAYVRLIRHVFARTVNPQFDLLHVRYLSDVLPAIERTDVSVILLDVNLPDGNGIEWLREHRTRLSAAVIVLTEFPEFGSDSTIEGGAQDFLVKSEVEPAHLIRTVRYGVDRERVHRELVRSREYFQSLIENARDLITVIDDRGIVLYQSPASTALLGHTPDSLVGRSIFDLVAADDVPGARAMVSGLFDAGHPTARGEFSVHHQDGGLRVLDMVASRIPSAGERRRAVINARDETERRRAEEALQSRIDQLRQSQKMEAIGRLAGGIAHDFSNLLTVITTACERLAERSDPVLQRDFDTILRNCDRAAGLTRQLLAFSRQQTLAPEPMNLAELVSGTGQLLKQLIGEHIALVLDIPSEQCPVEADRVQMEQVLLNLAINARDAMPEGGELRVRLRNVTVGDQFAKAHTPMAPGEYVLLEIADDGHGMSPEIRARAFEPFFTTKHPTKGTGLGLSTVYGIVKQSGGFIWLDSEMGVGTTFRVYLPPTDAAPVAPAPAPVLSASSSGGTATILLTEDEEDVRELLVDMLTAHGFTVLHAATPAEAIERSRGFDDRIDILLTDMVMPGATGRELAETLKGERPDLRVLYISGYPEHGNVQGPRSSLIEPGASFLSKPFTRDLLLTKVRSLLG